MPETIYKMCEQLWSYDMKRLALERTLLRLTGKQLEARLIIFKHEMEVEAETKEGWDEDGEPVGSVGPVILNELRLTMQKIFHPGAGVNNNNETNNNNYNTIVGVAVVVVRYFGSQLLGVTCGRLSGCYQSIVRQTLHRSLAPASSPQELELLDRYDDGPESPDF